MQPLVIAMATDQNYISSLLTAIKSLMYNNDHVKIYVINTDIPQEWFSNLNRFLVKLDSQVIDKKIDAHSFDNLATPGSYVTYMAYGRLLIPNLISDEKVLYLDSDTIVNDDLRPVFNTELGDHYIGAVRDCVIDGFNSGVMLINNQKLSQEKEKIQELFKAGQNSANQQADQTALNAIFGNDYLSLADKYNYMIGSERDLFYHPEGAGDFFERLKRVTHPAIIHYTSADKPWKLTSGGTMRNIWWQYHDLSWPEIIERAPLPPAHPSVKGHFFTFTQSLQLENFAELVKAMPSYEFNVASWVPMAPELMHFIEYPNVRLFPVISGPKIDELCQQMDAYLDINMGGKEEQFIDRANKLNKPIFAFNSSSFKPQSFSNYHVFNDDDVDGMITALQKHVNKQNTSTNNNGVPS